MQFGIGLPSLDLAKKWAGNAFMNEPLTDEEFMNAVEFEPVETPTHHHTAMT